MRLTLSAVLALALIAGGCSGPISTGASSDAASAGVPTSSAATSASDAASAGVPTSSAATSASDAASAEPAVSIVDTDPFIAASLRLIELAGTTCVRQKEVEPNIAGYGLEDGAAALSGREGLIAGGRAYVGSVRAAAKAFNASEVLQQRDGGTAVAIGRAASVQDIPEGAPIGYVLVPIALKDARTAWLRIGSYVASIPCSPEAS